jgi:hypothetical protein
MSMRSAATILGLALPLLAGCGWQQRDDAPAFVAANASTAIVDYARGSAEGLSAARNMAAEKCGLFGAGGAVLESLNVVAGGRERATFLCK